MIYCEKCTRVLGAIRESEEIDVTGEIMLLLLCHYCGEPNNIVLYEYGNKKTQQREKIKRKNRY
ncbi:hypothetical protein CN367_11790 [Priestia megaterium]|nr:hypothetical protein CN367_11790 [Priestia megaterium]